MLPFLWHQREKPPLFSPRWFKSWAKRLLLLHSLLGWSFRLARLRARGASIGEGSMIAPASIHGASWLIIGQNTFIGRIHIQAQAVVNIGSNVCINDGVRVITASHDVRHPSWQQFAKPIHIEDFAWIATGATILPGVTIGRGAVVGASAVIAKDVPAFAVAVGSPAQIRQNIRPATLDYNPVRFLALFTALVGDSFMNYTLLIVGGFLLIAIGLYNWRYGVFAALVLVIIEGAIRKWLLPQNSQIVYFAKEIVLLSAYARFFFLGGSHESGSAHVSFNDSLKILMAVCAGWIFLGAFNPEAGSPTAGLFGWRSYVIFIPLCLMVPSLFENAQQLERFLRFYLLIALPVGLLGMAQFYAPPESPLNVYAAGVTGTSEGSEVAVFGEDRFVRVTGTFSYISGYSTYLVFTLALLLPVLVSVKSNLWRTLLGAAVIVMAGNMGMTGSRSTVLGACIVLIGFVILTFLTGSEGERSRSGIHLIAGVGALISIRLLFNAAFLALQQRVDYDWEENQTRIFASVIEPLDYLGFAGIFGHGPGVTQPAVGALRAMLHLKDAAIQFSSPTDSENTRVLVELGNPPGFFLWYGLRILLVIFMWRTRSSLKSPFLRQVALGAFLVLLFQLFAVTVFGPTSNIYHWFLVGFIPLLPKLDAFSFTAAVPVPEKRRRRRTSRPTAPIVTKYHQ